MDSTIAPVASVVIPTYNRPQLVVRAIRSVLAQTYQDFEILVMDDSRNEETKNAVAEIYDKRIRYIYNAERLGFVDNKNQGVRLSNPFSQYIAFLDDDDEYLPLFLERTIGALENNSEAVAACTDCELRHQDGTFIKRYYCERNVYWRVSLGNGSIIRKDVFTKLDIWFDRNIAFEDLDFGLRVVKDYAWIGIPEVLRIYYRYYSKMGNSMSTAYTKVTPRETMESLFIKDAGIYASAGNQALAWVHSVTGKMLLRAGHAKAGREHLIAALRCDFHLSYLFHYFIALIFPSSFSKPSMAVFKNKIMGIFKQ